MKKDWNCGGGDTVFVKPKDSLADVSETHKSLVAPAIEAAFRDARGYFRSVADRCPFTSLRQYLHDLVTGGRWELRLHTNGHGSPGMAAFAFLPERVHGVEISLPGPMSAMADTPSGIRSFYSLVNWFHWSVYGGAGGLDCLEGHQRIAAYPEGTLGDGIDARDTFVWGSTGCGDMFIYTRDDKAGMLCHENGFVHIIGTVAETIDWICSELTAGREPEFDYSRWLRKS